MIPMMDAKNRLMLETSRFHNAIKIKCSHAPWRTEDLDPIIAYTSVRYSSGEELYLPERGTLSFHHLLFPLPHFDNLPSPLN